MNSVEERKERLRQNTATMGKLPPQALDLEINVLGTIINDSDYYLDVADIIKPFHFYQESHSVIMTAIQNLSNGNHPIDISTVANELRRMGQLEIVGGNYYIINLTKSNLSGNSIEFHCRIIIQKFMQRELIRISSDAITASYEDTTDIFELIEKNQSHISEVLSDTHKKQPEQIGKFNQEVFEDLAVPAVDGLTGVPSGFTGLDRVTGGWQKQDLIIVAARPAMGKTAFTVCCARNAAVDFEKPVAVFSLEMSSVQISKRLISRETEIKLDDILKKRNMTEERIKSMQEKSEKLNMAPIFIDDTPALNIFEFRAKCRRLKAKYDIELIIVDYLQLMHSGEKNSGNRDAEIGRISRCLKSVAKELDVPVMALSQLSRALETRPGANGKRPMLSDLRESGNIEQDADMVIFLHRPEYYGILEDPQGRSVIGLNEVIIAKHRNGVLETIKTDFNGSIMRFQDWEAKSSDEPPVHVDIQSELFSTQNVTSGVVEEVAYEDHIVDEDPPF